MQKLTIGLKLDAKVIYLKKFEIQEDSDTVQKLISALSIFIKRNLGKEVKDAED